MNVVNQDLGSGRREVLPRGMRVRKRTEFLRIQASPKKASGKHYTLLARSSEAAPGGRWRLGVTVSKKVGNAVVRNLVKRWLRESFRRHVAGKPGGLDIVVIARPSAITASFQETRDEVGRLLDRLVAHGPGRA